MTDELNSKNIPPQNSSEMLLASEEQAVGLTPERQQRLESVARNRQAGLMVVMEDVWNPHNLAAIARSCDAFGIQEIAYTMQNQVDYDAIEVGKITSVSASKWLDYRIFETNSIEALQTLKSEGWYLVATVASDAAMSMYEMDFTPYKKLALLVGNERDGLSQAAQDLADLHLVIPMMGMIPSFNVSVATALILYEITRQRRNSPHEYRLSPQEADALIHRWQQPHSS
ncbi:RNA methyltransferase [Phototrophicus methaneseepsis]|uniref:tRNA (guanosine(18)-2'-O)-methyltransferase n=1 Tax=Phototrophicus methaneseepsis TaxID=2710758 RepID=A0A7S8IF54_9CHLR|nr:RNA methyltransferase [Phototrophicus methaneseepsis]QPC82573.1 RNA methyltransferase [Phototrophicus methaneseepsis]